MNKNKEVEDDDEDFFFFLMNKKKLIQCGIIVLAHLNPNSIA